MTNISLAKDVYDYLKDQIDLHAKKNGNDPESFSKCLRRLLGIQKPNTRGRWRGNAPN